LDDKVAGEFADTMAGAFKIAIARRPNNSPVRLLGPAECPIFKLKDFYRFHFQVQCEHSGLLHDILREVITVCKPPNKVEFQVDVDPYSML
jgi:primosomal protein N' (replication factor Y) (superfamily II helicase)